MEDTCGWEMQAQLITAKVCSVTCHGAQLGSIIVTSSSGSSHAVHAACYKLVNELLQRCELFLINKVEVLQHNRTWHRYLKPYCEPGGGYMPLRLHECDRYHVPGTAGTSICSYTTWHCNQTVVSRPLQHYIITDGHAGMQQVILTRTKKMKCLKHVFR